MTARGEAGYSLVELMLTATVLLVVLAASLDVLDGITRIGARVTATAQDVDTVRGAMTRLTRDLRDATTGGGEGVLLRAAPNDLVMKRVNPATGALSSVRWCLDARGGNLYRQSSQSIAVPAGDGCPSNAPGWSSMLVATHVVNGARPLFAYDSSALAEIVAVDASLAVDANPARSPREVALTSGVLLRNQNRRPVAAFSYVALPGRNVQLNAQGSRDPEGSMLTYAWKEGAQTLSHSGAVASYIAPTEGPRTIELTVTDSHGLRATATRTVQVQP